MTATPNHALQRTATAVTPAAPRRARRAAVAPASAVSELGSLGAFRTVSMLRHFLILVFGLLLTPLRAGSLENSEAAFKAAWTRADTAITAVSRVLIELGQPDRAKRFQDAQLAWERFHDAQTHYEAFNISAGGQTYRQHYLDIASRMLLERAKVLESYLEPIPICLPASSKSAK